MHGEVKDERYGPDYTGTGYTTHTSSKCKTTEVKLYGKTVMSNAIVL